MKAEDIDSFEHVENYIEGCINDLEAGISSKEETIELIKELLVELLTR